MATTPRDAEDLVSDGWLALGNGSWEEARDRFSLAVEQSRSATALEGLGWSAWWLNDAPVSFTAWEDAFRLFKEHGDRRGAARVAILLATNHFTRRGEHAVANGWLRRAHHLLEGLDPVPEHAMANVWDAYMAIFVEHDTTRSRQLSEKAISLARDLGAIDLEMLAQAIMGYALVSEGDIDEGLRLLDESTAAAVSGELTDLDSITTTCCFMICACEQVGDFGRAAQWCDTAMSISERWSYHAMFAYCRTHLGGLHIWQGDWEQAEHELIASCSELATTHPALAFEGILRLADLRRRQGRFAEAIALFDEADRDPLRMLASKMALVGRAALALDQDDPTTAAELAERFLRSIDQENRLEQVRALELLVRAQVAMGEKSKAEETLRRLMQISTASPIPSLRAAASYSEGTVAVAYGNGEHARRRFEDAVDSYAESGNPYEVARSRLELASVLASLQRPGPALREARAAFEVLDRMGAARDAERAAALVGQLRGVQIGTEISDDPRPALTFRQIEVLRLVARGKPDKEIAKDLRLSEHTVHRHISNIMIRLDTPSRAAAVAEAAKYKLL